MDIFEKFLADTATGQSSRNDNTPQEAEYSSNTSRVGGRPGIPAGTKVNYVEVIGQVVRQGALARLSNRNYNVRCLASTGPNNTQCRREFIATYHQIFYGSVFSCGCLKRLRHPPVRLEGERYGVVEVVQWDELKGWEMVCTECGNILYARRIDEVKALGMRCPDPHPTQVNK